MIFKLICLQIHLQMPSSDDYASYDAAIDDDDGCGDIRNARHIIYRTHLFVREFEYETRPADVTLVTQLSMDRLQVNSFRNTLCANHYFKMLDQLLLKWEGPVSVALYLSDSEANQLLQFAAESPQMSKRMNIGFHIVYKEGVSE